MLLADSINIKIEFDSNLYQDQAELQQLIREVIFDLNKLYGSKINPYPLQRIEDSSEIGFSFDFSEERFQAVILRLRNILRRKSLACKITFSWMDTRIDVLADESLEKGSLIDLSCVADAAKNDILFMPGRELIAEAMIFNLTRPEITREEDRRLELKQKRLEMSHINQMNVSRIKARAFLGKKTIVDKEKYFYNALLADVSKLRDYEESGSFAHKNFWPPLQELAENLGLPVSRMQVEYDEKVEDFRKKIEARKREKELEAARLRRAEEEREKRQKYHEKIHEVFKLSLFPGAYEQGQIEEFRVFLELPSKDALLIEENVKAQLYGSIDSSVGLEYSRLRALLYTRDWKEADRETERLILAGFSQDLLPLDEDLMLEISSVDLNTINDLWSRYSSHKFGFRSQLNIFQYLEEGELSGGKLISEFKRQLNWKIKQPWYLWFWKRKKRYDSLDFSINAVAGHLPTWRWCCKSLYDNYEIDDSFTQAFLSYLDMHLKIPSSRLNGNGDSPLENTSRKNISLNQSEK
jgi:hypothetical protein